MVNGDWLYTAAEVVFVVALSMLLALVAVVGLSYSGVYSPAIDYLFEATVVDTPYDDELVFSKDQIGKINDRVSMNDSEVGWCFDVKEGAVSDLDFVGYGEKDSIRMDCSGRDGELHSHTLLTSAPSLSDSDYNSLVVGGYEAECVVSGKVDSSSNPVSFNCFFLEDGDLKRYNIMIEEKKQINEAVA